MVLADPLPRVDPSALEDAKKRFDFVREVPGLTRQARTAGGEYHGPCPKCGGVDRFVAWPRHPDGPHAFCRQCHPEPMDPVAFLQWRDGLAFVEAARRLGVRAAAPRPGATYAYQDAAGQLLYQVVRLEPKSFRGRQPRPGLSGAPRNDVDTDWRWDLGGVERVLYRLPQLLAAAPDDVVWLVEGEKDADALAALGLVATTNPHGAGKWQASYTAALAGRHVVFLPDADPPGQAHRDLVLPQLLAAGCRVKVLTLPDAKDVSAWLARGGTRDALLALATAAPLASAEASEEAPPAPAPPPGRFRFLDLAALAALPPPTWLIDGLVPAGALACLYGPSGAGKSFFALDWALSVASGVAWAGHPVAPGPAVYLAAEGTAGLAARAAAWQLAHPAAPPPAFWVLPDAVNLRDGQVPPDLLASLPARPALIVVDTLARAMPGADENSAQDMGTLVAAADVLRKGTGATVLLIHHTGKAGQVERGSSALRAACDTMLALSGDDGLVTLECDKQKDAPPAPLSTFILRPVGDSCVPAPAGPADRDAASPLTPALRLVLEALASPVLAGGATATELRGACDLNERAIYRALKGLEVRGYVTVSGPPRTQLRRYHATPRGAAAVGLTASDSPLQEVFLRSDNGLTSPDPIRSDTTDPGATHGLTSSDKLRQALTGGLTSPGHSSDRTAPTLGGAVPVRVSELSAVSEPDNNAGPGPENPGRSPDLPGPNPAKPAVRNPWGRPPATAPPPPRGPCPRCGEAHYAWLETGGWTTLCYLPDGTPPPPPRACAPRPERGP